MKEGIHNYKYKLVIGGRGYFGEVCIQIVSSQMESTVTDKCDWNLLKETYPNFKPVGIYNLWKQSAIDAANSIIRNYPIPKCINVIIHDVTGMILGSSPCSIGAATIIAIFDYCEIILDKSALQELDFFVIKNEYFDIIPDFNLLIMSGR